MTFSLALPVAVGPSGPGALSGFATRCSCGLEIRSSLATIAAADAVEHVAWHRGRGEDVRVLPAPR